MELSATSTMVFSWFRLLFLTNAESLFSPLKLAAGTLHKIIWELMGRSEERRVGKEC